MLNPSDIENTIHFGDCLDLLRQLPDQSVDLVLTDPPYGIGGVIGGRFERYGAQMLEWDKAPPSPEVFEEIFRVSKNQIIWGGELFRPSSYALF